MGNRFKAWMVFPIAAIAWVALPTIFQFASWKKLGKEYETQFSARNAARGAYSSDTQSKEVWPGPGRAGAKYAKGQADQDADKKAVEKKLADLAVTLQTASKNRDEHKRELEKVLSRYMTGIDRSKFDYDKPDEFVLELLRQQRDEAGPRLIKFLDQNYRNLFFRFPIPVPPPDINASVGRLPVVGPEGRLSWPVGQGPLAFTVYGRYDDLLDFVETFPDRFDRIALISSFGLNRLAFDYRGSVLLQLNCSIEFFVWPTHAPGSPGAANAQGPAPGGMPGLPGAPPPGGGMPGMPPPGGAPGGSGGPAGAPAGSK